MTTTIRNVTVLGAGVLGSQIAFQTAYKGFDVISYDIDEPALVSAKERFDRLAATYTEAFPDAEDGATDAALDRITQTDDLATAAADADLIIEAVPEILTLKQETYQKLATLAPAGTIFATNSSTLLPSDLKDSTGRPDRFLALHFANMIWVSNTAEIMGTTDTDPAVFAEVVEFAAAIGMVPIQIHKEKAGWARSSGPGWSWSRADMPSPATSTARGASRPDPRWGRCRSTTSSVCARRTTSWCTVMMRPRRWPPGSRPTTSTRASWASPRVKASTSTRDVR